MLHFTDKQEIQGYSGKDKERVDFEEKDWVDVNLGDRKGCVEKWLGVFEQIMMKDMKDKTAASYEDYQVCESREKWVMDWAGQVVLGVD
jgi:hypothetical protein